MKTAKVNSKWFFVSLIWENSCVLINIHDKYIHDIAFKESLLRLILIIHARKTQKRTAKIVSRHRLQASFYSTIKKTTRRIIIFYIYHHDNMADKAIF